MSEGILNVSKLAYGYSDISVLKSVSFTAFEHECIGILGRNGSGKTTLLKALAGISKDKPSSGKVIVRGKNIWPLDQSEKASLVTYIPATVSLSHEISLENFLLQARFHHGEFWRNYTVEDLAAVRTTAEQFKISTLLKKSVTKLSSGQVQLALIARGVLQDSPVLLLDEALNHLDLDRLTFVFSILKAHAANTAKAILWTHHDFNMLSAGSSRILALHEGSILKDGPPASVLTEETMKSVFGEKHNYSIHQNAESGRPFIQYNF